MPPSATVPTGALPLVMVVPDDPGRRGLPALMASLDPLWSEHVRLAVADPEGGVVDLGSAATGGATVLLGVGGGSAGAAAAAAEHPRWARALVLAAPAEPPPAAVTRSTVPALIVTGGAAGPVLRQAAEAWRDALDAELVVLEGVGAEVHRAGRRFLDLLLGTVAQAEPIALAEPDPAWRARSADLREEIVAALGHRVLGIEHVGSTAVPGLVAKPIIDLLLGVRDPAEAEAAIPALRALAWCYAEGLGVLGERRYLFRLERGRRVAHLHIVPFGGIDWVQRLAFRDRLRASPATAAAYTRLKRDLARRHPGDREAYTDGKAAFIARASGQSPVPRGDAVR